MIRGSESGVALIVVLFLSAILTLLMYVFLREMQVEYSLASSLAEEKQAEQLAWSAIERAISTVTADASGFASVQSPWYDSAADWYEIEVTDPDGAAVGVYSLVHAPASGGASPACGLSDEASRININVAPRDVLLKLPRCTDEIADSIVDWRDPDDTPTGIGGESAHYLSLQPGYGCKNGPFDTVEELLLVKGVTGEVFYGEDANLNGILDPNEDDGELSPPNDNSDGVLDAGLAAHATVWSWDRNVRSDGQGRININTATNQQLTEALGDVLSPPQINAIPARRALVAVAVQSPGFRSGADLMDVAGVAMPGISAEQYREIADRVTVFEGQNVPGLINVNTAPRRVLEMLPGWTAEDVGIVMEKRAQAGQDLSSVGWLTEALPAAKVQSAAPYLTVASYQFRMDALGRVGPKSRLEASATVTEAVDEDAPADPPRATKRFLSIFDKGASPARLVYWKDISRLGLPYAVEEPEESP